MLLFAVALASACEPHWQRTDTIARNGGMTRSGLVAGNFELVTYSRSGPPGTPVVIFLEGDGRPWVHGNKVAVNPTARNPLALRLAAVTPAEAVYLSRPCYDGHVTDVHCRAEIWTSARYGETVVAALSLAVKSIAASRPARPVWLVGYSGGGTLAVLVAARVPMVVRVITIAANLDVDAWVKYHGYSPLDSSLDSAREPSLSPSVRQLHLYGTADRIIPVNSAERFAATQPAARAIAFDGFEHACCWLENWGAIWHTIARED